LPGLPRLPVSGAVSGDKEGVKQGEEAPRQPAFAQGYGGQAEPFPSL